MSGRPRPSQPSVRANSEAEAAMEFHTVWGPIENSTSSNASSRSHNERGDVASSCSGASNGMRKFPSELEPHQKQPERKFPTTAWALQAAAGDVTFRDSSSSSSSLGTSINQQDSDTYKTAFKKQWAWRLQGKAAALIQAHAAASAGQSSSSAPAPSSPSAASGGGCGSSAFPSSAEADAEPAPPGLPAEGLDLQEEMLLIKTLEEANVWSQGSYMHLKGSCTPCHGVFRGKGCLDGAVCAKCHFPHTDGNSRKLGMWKRRYCRTFAQAVLLLSKETPERFERLCAAASSSSGYLHLCINGLADGDMAPEEAKQTEPPTVKRMIVSL